MGEVLQGEKEREGEREESQLSWSHWNVVFCDTCPRTALCSFDTTMKKKLPASNLALCPLALKDAVLVIVAGHDIREGDDGMADSRVFHSLSKVVCRPLRHVARLPSISWKEVHVIRQPRACQQERYIYSMKMVAK